MKSEMLGVSAMVDLENPASIGTKSKWIVAVLVGLTFAACYFRSFVFPNIPVLLWGDQLGAATDASRMLAGQLPYRDYFELLTPGSELVYASLFKVFGVSLWIPNLTMACMAAATTFFMTLCVRYIVPGPLVALPSLLFVGFVLYGSLDAMHHWFSTVVIMASMLILLKGATYRRVAAAGALCGVAASFTQSKGAAAVMALLVYIAFTSLHHSPKAVEVWRKCLLLCATSLAVFAAINAHFILAAGLNRWIDSVIIFPIRYYPSVSINNWRGTWPDFQGRTGGLKWLCFPFMYCVTPLTYIAVLWTMRRRGRANRSELSDRLLLVILIGIAMLVAIAPALSIKRLSSVSPPAMVLLAWLLSRPGKRLAVAAGTLAAVSLAIALAMVARTQTRPWAYLDLPAGRVAIADPAVYEEYRWTAEHTQPGQMYFGMPTMYVPLRLQNPAPIQAPAPSEYTRPEQIAAVIEALQTNRVRMLILRPSMYIPHLLGYPSDHLQMFQDYLYRNYHQTTTFLTGDEVWERF
jgi:hypothetical protein